MKTWSRLWVVTLVVAISCDGGAPDGAKIGDLSNGYFVYECATGYDVVCWELCSWGSACPQKPWTDSEFPDEIALGSRFEVRYEPESGSDIATAVAPVSLAWLGVSGNTLLAKKGGSSSILARAVISGEVLDYTHVRVVQTVGIVVTDTSGEPIPSSVVEGASIGLMAYPVNSVGQVLAGSLEWTWTVDDGTVVSEFGTVGLPKRTIVAAGPGKTNLKVSAGGITQVFPITVVAKNGGNLPVEDVVDVDTNTVSDAFWVDDGDGVESDDGEEGDTTGGDMENGAVGDVEEHVDTLVQDVDNVDDGGANEN